MIELYINKQLCDIESPNNFPVFLKRQFLNPSQLNTKDAQKSYSITLPATGRNNEIFGFKSIEEVRSKFAVFYDAYLTIGGIKIFDGKFELRKITRSSYSGILGVPKQIGISDIFGQRMMNQAGDWIILFGEFADSIKTYNRTINSECIFPYVLYGLLPKKSVNGEFSDKDLWDETVFLGIDDFPPSINCLQTIKKIFNNEGLNISGSAFADQRLNGLYMSYKNPSEYQMPWNYGKLGVVKLEGTWSNFNRWSDLEIVERFVSQNEKESDDNRKMYVVDLFKATNANTIRVEDKGNNVTIERFENEELIGYQSVNFVVPYSGLYKVQFDATITLEKEPNINKKQNVRVISPVSRIFDVGGYIEKIQGFDKRRFEVKLMRNWNDGYIDMNNVGYDRSFYKNNQNQNDNFDTEDSNNFPKIFPKPDEVVFVDPLQNPNLVCGVSFGANYDKNNPLDIDNLYCNPIAIKHGVSWSSEADNKKFSQSAVYNSGYTVWGKTTEGEIDFFASDKLKVDLLNTATYTATEDNYTKGNGLVEQVIWLNKGEKLTVCAMSDEGVIDVPFGAGFQTYKGWLIHDINYTLNIEAYRSTDNWLKMDDLTNASTGVIDWKDTDPTDRFHSDEIDLIKFLPSEIKIDDWIENFCKAFNLVLTRLDNGAFELNVRQTRRTYSQNPINLDLRAHIDHRENEPLDLPSLYEIGFTINKDEQGYISTNDDGGGTFYTGNLNGNVINQTSFFSHNWYKNIRFSNNTSYDIPVITEAEIWKDTTKDYEEMMKKDFINSAQRFWYKSNNLEVSGFGKDKIEIALVKSSIDNSSTLNYKNKSFSILNNYFTIFVDNDSCYTVIECYLKPDEYNRLPYSLVILNGDLYYPAEIDGYDPLLRQKAILKLIRKII